MPEGHTIHRNAEDLNEAFAGQALAVTSPQGRFAHSAARIDHTPFVQAQAVGKHLLMEFANDAIVHVHLGLYGAWNINPLVNEKAAPPVGQVRLRLLGKQAVADLRGPTQCELVTSSDVALLLNRLGPDPLRVDADEKRAWNVISKSSTPICVLLMRQDIVSGVGNVYRAEVLFRLGIDPLTPGRNVDRKVWLKIWRDLVTLMRIGVEIGQIDTVRSKHLPERTGRAPRIDRHGGEVYVYRRESQPCLVCSTPILKREVAARNLFWCPTCQK